MAMAKIQSIEPLKENDLNNDEIVRGFDEQTQKWVLAQYRDDSNRFFSFPYDGSVYPIDRMNKYRRMSDQNQKMLIAINTKDE